MKEIIEKLQHINAVLGLALLPAWIKEDLCKIAEDLENIDKGSKMSCKMCSSYTKIDGADDCAHAWECSQGWDYRFTPKEQK